MDVTAALYSHGTLLLAESSGPNANATKLLLAARNYTLPPPSINTNTTSQSVWLREVVSELSQLVPGEARRVLQWHGPATSAVAGPQTEGGTASDRAVAGSANSCRMGAEVSVTAVDVLSVGGGQRAEPAGAR